MSNDNGANNIVQFATRAADRAAHYLDRAAQLRQMAADEPIDRVRDDLLRLADQYEGLAARVT